VKALSFCLGGPIMPNLFGTGRLGRLSVAAAGALTALAVTAGDVLAADAAHGGEHKGGLPQLNPETFPTQIFWLALAFGALYYLMSKRALPRVAEVLEQRQARISADLNKAAETKEEAEKVLAAVEAAIAEARSSSQAAIAESVAASDKAAAERGAAVAGAVAERLRQAEARIQAAKDEAVANVRSAAADIARDIVGKLAGVAADPAAAEAAVAASMEGARS
jgi:F-type H+-transporting ATPase subunit b